MREIVWTKQEWIEEQLDCPLYGGKIMIAGGMNSYFEEFLYFEFDCPETFEIMKPVIEDEYHGMAIAPIDMNELPDEFEISKTIVAGDIPCDEGRYNAKAAWLWNNEETNTIIAIDEISGYLFFEFENDITWDFFKGSAERRYGASLRAVSHDELPEIFIIVDEWCEYDI